MFVDRKTDQDECQGLQTRSQDGPPRRTDQPLSCTDLEHEMTGLRTKGLQYETTPHVQEASAENLLAVFMEVRVVQRDSDSLPSLKQQESYAQMFMILVQSGRPRKKVKMEKRR